MSSFFKSFICSITCDKGHLSGCLNCSFCEPNTKIVLLHGNSSRMRGHQCHIWIILECPFITGSTVSHSNCPHITGVVSSQVSPDDRSPPITGVPSSQVSSHLTGVLPHHRCPQMTGVPSSQVFPLHRCPPISQVSSLITGVPK